ncbi:MAG: DUF3810 domain-containing protein [Oscillospiraceae bacterium]|nr:DUF3810 domain-containing protein [Oscillospiraceae bacterium]
MLKKTRNDWLMLISALLVTAAMLLLVFASTAGGFGEWYRASVYPLLQGSLGRLSGAVPFSVAELLCIVLPFIIIYDLYDILRRSGEDRKCGMPEPRTGQAGIRLNRFLKRLMLLAALLFFLYEACCGVNYHSDPFVPRDVYDSASFTVEQLAEFCEYTAGELKTIYTESYDYSESASETESNSKSESVSGTEYKSENAAGLGREYIFLSYPEWSVIAETAVDAMEELGHEYPELSGYYPRPKKITLLSRLFSMMGVSGIYSPFTIEANVNGEMEGMEKPFTACHELSHLRGYMNEGEANYIGWLACIGSEDRSFNRSGWLIAWIYAGRSLRQADPELYEKIRAQIPEAALAEIRANDEFWAKHENKASEVQSRINDAYLKSNGVEEGIASYGQLTTLMLHWYFAEGSSRIADKTVN